MLVLITEGDDEVFIQKYMEHLGCIHETDFITLSVGGWSKIQASKPKIDELIDAGHDVVLIFDADGDYNDGGFAKRTGEINTILHDNKLNLDFFLLPNNADDGDFEDLLERIAADERTGVFSCFDGYEACVQALENEQTKFKTPLKKSRIFAYIETFNESNKRKNKERKDKTYFYDNPNYWNLDSDELIPLRNFIMPRLGK